MDLIKYFFKEYPERTILVCIAVTVSSIITAITLTALPILLGLMLGRNTAKAQAFNQFFEYIGINPTTENLLQFLIIGILAQNIILAGARIYAGFTLAKIVKNLRVQLLTAMSQAEWRFFINQPSGELTASLMTEADLAGESYMTTIDILASAVQAIAYLTVAFIISWEIAVIAIATSLILFLLFKKFIAISRKLGVDGVILLRQITAQLTDSTRSIKSLKAMARESHMNALLDSYTKKLRAVSKKSTKVSESLDMLQEIFLMGAIIFTLYFSFRFLDIPIEFAIILVFIYLRTMKLFGKIQKQIQLFAANRSGYEHIMQSIHIAEDNHEARTGTIKHTLQGDIRIEDISFSYHDKVIFDNASATIYHNKLNSIIGPSGTGKTTLLDLICGLYLPTSGNIFIDDVSLNNIDISFWRQQIGYVVQETTLLNTTIKENITLGDASFTDEQVQLALHRAHADSFIESQIEGIDTIVGEAGANLSGGQRQRILIARALVHSPKLLILDEATSALDSKTEKSLSEVFKELSREITIISISHRPALVNVSDQIIELHNGKLSSVEHPSKNVLYEAKQI